MYTKNFTLDHNCEKNKIGIIAERIEEELLQLVVQPGNILTFTAREREFMCEKLWRYKILRIIILIIELQERNLYRHCKMAMFR